MGFKLKILLTSRERKMLIAAAKMLMTADLDFIGYDGTESFDTSYGRVDKGIKAEWRAVIRKLRAIRRAP